MWSCVWLFLFSLPFRGENATITYHLQFGVPSEDKNFMKYMMSEELVLGILLQDFHDQNLSGCETLELDPESLLLYGKLSKSRRQSCAGEQVSQAGGRRCGLISVGVMFPVPWTVPVHSLCPPWSDWIVGGKSWKKKLNYKDEDCWMFSCCSSLTC